MAAGILWDPVDLAWHVAARADPNPDLLRRLLLPFRFSRDFDCAVRTGRRRRFLLCCFGLEWADVPEGRHPRRIKRGWLCSLPLVLTHADGRTEHAAVGSGLFHNRSTVLFLGNNPVVGDF